MYVTRARVTSPALSNSVQATRTSFTPRRPAYYNRGTSDTQAIGPTLLIQDRAPSALPAAEPARARRGARRRGRAGVEPIVGRSRMLRPRLDHAGHCRRLRFHGPPLQKLRSRASG